MERCLRRNPEGVEFWADRDMGVYLQRLQYGDERGRTGKGDDGSGRVGLCSRVDLGLFSHVGAAMSGGLQTTANASLGKASERASCVIRLVDVYKTCGKQAVLYGVNLEIPRGRLTTMIGRRAGGECGL